MQSRRISYSVKLMLWAESLWNEEEGPVWSHHTCDGTCTYHSITTMPYWVLLCPGFLKQFLKHVEYMGRNDFKNIQRYHPYPQRAYLLSEKVRYSDTVVLQGVKTPFFSNGSKKGNFVRLNQSPTIPDLHS